MERAGTVRDPGTRAFSEDPRGIGLFVLVQILEPRNIAEQSDIAVTSPTLGRVHTFWSSLNCVAL